MCLNLSNGFFIPTSWSTAATTNVGSVTVTRSSTQITIQRAGQSGSVTSFGDFLYAVFGDQGFVAVLKRDAGAGSITWTVTMVDTTGATISSRFLFSQSLPSSQFPPQLAVSQGNGRLAFFFSGTSTANSVTNMIIVRSDDGSVVLGGVGTINNLFGNVTAEITATQLIIHHPNTGANDSTAATRPAGFLTAVPGTQDFGEAVLGASDASLATTRRTFTLGNNGTDCITVTGIGNDTPFSVSNTTFPIELEPGETQTVEVTFAPTAPGNNISGSLPITRSPATGASSLECVGDARNATAAISVTPGSINFGTIPHLGTDTRSFSINNTGELDVFVNIPAPTTGTAFSWTTVGTLSLPVSGPSINVPVTFTTPGDAAAAPVTLTIVPSAGSSDSITFNGAGCIANAIAVLPPAVPIDFGNVERGFRTVRFREVRNVGDGDLNLRARIAPGSDAAHAALFRLVLPGQDITDGEPQRDYLVLPTTRCGGGPLGGGRVDVAVSFHADAAPSTTPYTAVLEIDDPVSVTTSRYALSATVTPAVPVDAVLVFDKSGSMSDPSGARTKIEAAQSAGRLFARMLREDAEDRAAIISFNENPSDDFPIDFVAGNAGALDAALGFAAAGATNIAGGVIVGEEEYSDPSHPSNPPELKKAMVVLSDGKENTCFQIGGSGDWFSITGRDAPDMRRPDGTPQDSEILPSPTDFKIYGIGLGDPDVVDGAALDALSSATGGHFDHVVDLSGSDFFLLEKYFTQIFMDTAGLAIITDPFYTIVPGDKHEHDFDIFPGDVNTMVVIYDHPKGRLPFFLVSPLGEQISGANIPPGFGLRLRSTPTARFVEVTFPSKETKRYAGRWKAVVLHEGRVCFGDVNPPDERNSDISLRDNVERGFQPTKCRETKDPVDYGIAIAAGSNLRLQAFVEPGVKYIGETIRLNAVLLEAGLPVKNASVRVFVKCPSGTTFSVTLHDDGLNSDGEADDGDYGSLFTKATEGGVFQFVFRAEGLQAGKPFVREAHRSKTVYDPRKPPTTDQPGDCCRKLIELLRERIK